MDYRGRRTDWSNRTIKKKQGMMTTQEIYTINEQKELGAFYTPKILSDLLAYHTISLLKNDKNKVYTVADPATGDSALLLSFHTISQKQGIKTRYIGIDIEERAICHSIQLFSGKDVEFHFVNTDGLYPYNSNNPSAGWSNIKKDLAPNGISFFVSNPPWGADKSKYKSLCNDFNAAKGQFDIYDLFIETIIDNLEDGGYYGIIVPDSIYNVEHKPIREYLFTNTTIKRIIRLGEGFFPEVNIAVSLIFGINKRSKNHDISCSHLSNNDRRKVLANTADILEVVKRSECKISSKLMVDSGYLFLTDIKQTDINLMGYLSHCPTIKQFTTSQRGVELSKKGIVSQCPKCKRWFPEPKGKIEATVRCPHCKESFIKKDLHFVSIINKSKHHNSAPIIVGESIFRYNTVSQAHITKGIDGINYKDDSLYLGSKILVRKTGVGITAGIDYNNCLTNQVVYIYKRKNNIDETITNEVILAVLNSRIVTYYIIMKFGSTGWKTHAYMSQTDVSSLPFPSIDIKNERTKTILNNITQLVKENSVGKTDEFSKDADAKIEQYVAELFQLNEKQYEVIYTAIQEVQKMIPFKRLLNVTPKMIFQNGL